MNIKSKLFWKTLRMVPKKGNIFTRGVSCNVVVTTRCPYRCTYCPSFIYGDPKIHKESTVEEWKTFLDRFQARISLVYVSGGETSLYKDIVPLVNYLTEKRHHVIVQTNLFKPENFIGIIPRYNLIFHATYHQDQEIRLNKNDFFERAKVLEDQGLNVITQQVGNYDTKTKRNKEFFTEDWFKYEDDSITFEPSTPSTLRMWTGCINMYKK